MNASIPGISSSEPESLRKAHRAWPVRLEEGSPFASMHLDQPYRAWVDRVHVAGLPVQEASLRT